jgi:poly-gamma-glutamate synthase PgsB/CapB
MQTLLATGIVLTFITIFLLFLIIEVICHNRRLNSIPTRISITGTRGKTTVTRLLASILRESGHIVLAKTTGTEAKYILPDGSEQSIKRVGAPNILEQKKLIRKASVLKVDFLISEIMSIQPENHRTETQKLLKPNYTIITNFYPDHLDAAPDKNMALLYANDIHNNSTVIIDKDDIDQEFKKSISDKKAKIIEVDPAPLILRNQHKASKLAEVFTCTKENIYAGIQKAEMDKGETRGFTLNRDESFIFINLFAANDPISSMQIIEEIIKRPKWKDFNILGLLSLRSDRAERSIQWLEFLKTDESKIFAELFYSGSHRHYFYQTLKIGRVINSSDPAIITDTISAHGKSPSLVFGLANIGNTGLKLVDYWDLKGQKINL